MADKPTRNDAMLDTGLSSAVERRAQARSDEQRRKRSDQRARLTPGAEIVLEWIDKEINEAADLRKIIINVADEEHVKAQLLARQMHLTWLEDIKNRAKNMLREVNKPDAIDPDVPEAWADAAKAERAAKIKAVREAKKATS